MRAYGWRNIFSILCLISSSALISCAIGEPALFSHGFSFNVFLDGTPDIEVLDYQYGNSGQFGTHANKGMIAMGQTFSGWGTFGVMPRGEFLYVKWKIKDMPEIHEDKVDLTRHLPKDITNYGIHFVVRGPQLYVYLIPPPGIWSASAVEQYPDYRKKLQIYPDQDQ